MYSKIDPDFFKALFRFIEEKSIIHRNFVSSTRHTRIAPGIFVVLHEPIQHAIYVISTVAFIDIYHKGMFLDGFGGDGYTNIDTGLEQWFA